MGGLFRGVRAPASLKRVKGCSWMFINIPIFRGVRAPASLKLLVGSTLADATRSLPGRTRPGLIEAKEVHEADGGNAPLLFRGVRAPASLKLDHRLEPHARGLPALPGRTRPGLIEASRRGWSCKFGPGLFRGVRAPASLKPGDSPFLVAAPGILFRGVRAPASLKRPSRRGAGPPS